MVEEAGVPGENHEQMGQQLVNFITCGCESSALFFVIYKTNTVLMIGLYELLGNPTTLLIEPPSC
jgi:hypothetical protein